MDDAPSDDECPDAGVLAALVHGAISDDDYRTVSQHLAGCPSCCETLAATARLWSRHEESAVDPPWPLAPALVTAVVFAVMLTVSLLWLLGRLA